MSPSPRDNFNGICRRNPEHVGVHATHSCGEFTRFEPDNLRPLPERAVRKTRETTIGNWLLEMTPLEAVVVEWALRMRVYERQLSGAMSRAEEREILNRVIDRMPHAVARDRSDPSE
jgi:hypothetical protein